MAQYTTQVRTICESLYQNKLEEFTSVADVIAAARPHIFDFTYPIFDENYRSVLETKILKHYYTREIGLETYGLWKLKLDTKLNEIMPYYNKLYESEQIKYNPLFDHDIWRKTDGTKKHDESGSSKSDRNGNTTGKITEDRTTGDTLSGTDKLTIKATGTDNRLVTTDTDTSASTGMTNFQSTNGEDDSAFSDTPQGSLSRVQNLEYLTTYTQNMHKNDVDGGSKTESTGKGTVDTQDDFTTDHTDTHTTEYGKKTSGNDNRVQESTSNTVDSTTGSTATNATTTDDYIEHIAGKTGGKSYPQMIMELRETFINIDMMIIRDLKDLFMLIY